MIEVFTVNIKKNKDVIKRKTNDNIHREHFSYISMEKGFFVMVVIYAEKASLAKEIAHALGAEKRIPLKDEPTVGYYKFKFKGEDAVLCHGVGHLAELVPPKMYDEKYKTWELENYPCVPENFIVAPKAATIKCMKLVKTFFDKADWLINATDADREGELIFAYICEVCKCNKPYKRVWIDDLTNEKLIKAFNNLKEPDEPLSPQYQGTATNLRKAGRARSITDWLWGINLTIAASVKYGDKEELFSIGRVITATTNLVVMREKDIMNHIRKPFWKLYADFRNGDDVFRAEYEQGSFEFESDAINKLNNCKGYSGTVQSVESKKNKISAPLLYNTTQLQIAASKYYDWDSKKTTKIMQSLYEKKYMSYPRTSTEHLTVEMVNEVKRTIIKLLKLPEYKKYSLNEWTPFTKRHFDNSKVGSHTAVIPTENVPDNLDILNEDEKMLYDLLAKSLIRIIYPKVIKEETRVIINVNNNNFKATGTTLVNKGWYNVDAMPDKLKVLPIIQEKQIYNGEYNIKKGETEPPARYTEASLLDAMELAGQKIDDEQVRTLMKMQKKGLGTDATRAKIIETMYDRGYIIKKGKSLYATEKGMFIIETLPVSELKSADATGELEKELNNIALGKGDFQQFIQQSKRQTIEWFAQIKNSEQGKFISAMDKLMICPCCGKKILKFDWGYGCSGYKDKSCSFSISAEIAGKKITDNNIIKLLHDGKTGKIKGFKNKDGKNFDAVLKINRLKQCVEFDFPKKKKMIF